MTEKEFESMNNKNAVFNYIATIIKNVKKDDLNISLFDIVDSISVIKMQENIKTLQGIDMPLALVKKHYKTARKKVRSL